MIYVILPLLIACLLLLLNEAQRLIHTRQSLRVASGLAAPVLAVLVIAANLSF